MRALYSLFWWLAMPLMFLYLRWRGRKQPEYRQHWRERLGWAPAVSQGPTIWLHTVSVGETRAAVPLVKAIRQRRPDATILFSHTTPTGRATAAKLYGADIHQTYLPYDAPGPVRRFLDRTRPGMAIFLETEIWPNLYAGCLKRGIPAYLVNARLSEKSAHGYGRIASLVRPALAGLAGVAAQTGADASRLAGLGAQAPAVVGNLKFDVGAPPDCSERAEALRKMFADRFVFLVASTREGEEQLILDTCLELGIPGLLVVVVPRHPQRFDEVAAMLESRGVEFVRRSQGNTVTREVEVFLGDSMGEMSAYFAAADVTFIGGSLVPLGGQNLIEAADMGCPIVIGPHTWNFLDAAEQAIECGAALRVQDAEELARTVKHLQQNPDKLQAMAEAGRQFSQANRGATARVMAMLEPVLARL
jgi:3-deoxy-D-manno-octulosonic-acid transferase